MIWNAIETVPQREFRVERDIRRRLGLTTYVPYIKSNRRMRGKLGRVVLIPQRQILMPRYVLVGGKGGVPLASVSRLDYVTGFVEFGGVPGIITPAEVDRIRRIAETADVETSGYRVGDAIVIRSGPFAGFRSLIERIRGVDVQVTVAMLGKPVALALSPDNIDRASDAI